MRARITAQVDADGPADLQAARAAVEATLQAHNPSVEAAALQDYFLVTGLDTMTTTPFEETVAADDEVDAVRQVCSGSRIAVSVERRPWSGV